MSRAGEYRAVPKGLCDQPEYQVLTPNAKLVLLTLRIGLNSAGIAVRYPEALSHQLAEQTGLNVDAVKLALDVLEHENAIKRDGNVVWVVQQLADDPLTWSNPKHKKSIQSVIDALPRNSVVAQFIRHYREWFAGTDGRLAHGYSWVGDRVAKPKRYPSATNKTKQSTTQHNTTHSARAAGGAGDTASAAATPPDPPTVPPSATAAWPATWAHDTTQRFLSHGVVLSTAMVGGHAKPVKHTMPWDEWLRVVDRMARSGDMGYGFPAMLRRLGEFRDAVQPDPNRPLSLEEAMGP